MLSSSSLSIPQLSACTIEKTSLNCILFSAVWIQDCIAASKKLRFSKNYFLRNNTVLESDAFPLQDSSSLLSCSSSQIKLAIRSLQKEDGANVDVLEVRVGEAECRSFILKETFHGKVYYDRELGSLDINGNGTKAVFIAEKKKKTKGEDEDLFFDLNQFAYAPSFGEQMEGKSLPVVVQVDLESGQELIRMGVPDNIFPGQVIFNSSNDRVYGVGIEELPLRQGIVWCTNQRSVLFELTNENTFRVLRGGSISVRCPRSSPDGKWLTWLERDLDPESLNAHQACARLMVADLSRGKFVPETIIDVFRKMDETRGFAGIYGPTVNRFPKRCYLKIDGKFHLVVNTFVGAIPRVVLCSPEESPRRWDLLSSSEHMTAMDCLEGLLLCSFSTPTSSPIITLCKVDPSNFSLEVIGSSHAYPTGLESSHFWALIEHFPTLKHPEERLRHVNFDSLFISPKSTLNQRRLPLILWPHGGPVAVFPALYSPTLHFFLNLGYSVLMVNFRGSTGRGQDAIDALSGLDGLLDVSDTHQAGQECLESYPDLLDPQRVFLFGGSHGGFIVLHLAAKYPEFYRACIARSPNTTLHTKFTTSDISCPRPSSFLQGHPKGISKEVAKFLSPSNECMGKLMKQSPVNYLEDLKMPVMIHVGKNDQRVPHTQGIYYYQVAKALGKPVELRVHEDNHSLLTVKVNATWLKQTERFFRSNDVNEEKTENNK